MHAGTKSETSTRIESQKYIRMHCALDVCVQGKPGGRGHAADASRRRHTRTKPGVTDACISADASGLQTKLQTYAGAEGMHMEAHAHGHRHQRQQWHVSTNTPKVSVRHHVPSVQANLPNRTSQNPRDSH
eukprot:1290081-Pleurochrysis_carterae.AAC.3